MQASQEKLSYLQQYLNAQVIGQELLIERLLIALLADGHLLSKARRLAKPAWLKHWQQELKQDSSYTVYARLWPSDLTGTDVFHPENASFAFMPGPLFHHLVLADEINRAPAKVQSALLEAMAERQITIGSKTYPLPELFLVLATQNPIEQEGTYPLPEAQLDRFLLYVKVDYPDASVEGRILELARAEAKNGHATLVAPEIKLSQIDLFKARKEVLEVFTSEVMSQYIIDLVLATRLPQKYPQSTLRQWIRFGASPRATMHSIDAKKHTHGLQVEIL